MLRQTLSVAVLVGSGTVAGALFAVALSMVPALMAMTPDRYLNAHRLLGRNWDPTMPAVVLGSMLLDVALAARAPTRQSGRCSPVRRCYCWVSPSSRTCATFPSTAACARSTPRRSRRTGKTHGGYGATGTCCAQPSPCWRWPATVWRLPSHDRARGTSRATREVGTLRRLGFDPFDPAHRADPYPYYHRLRERAPVYRSPRGYWLLSRHRDCVAVLRDPRFGHGSDRVLGRNTFRRPVGGRSLPFILLDPPEHTRLRSLVSKAFTPRMVERLGPRIERMVHDLLDVLIEQGDVELMAAFAYPLPVTVISELLGVPSADRPAIKDLSQVVARGVDPDSAHTPEELRRRAEAFARFDEYFRGLLAERRRKPTGDLLSQLAGVSEQGSVLTEGELLTTCILLYVAGHETTTDLLGNGTLALLRHPGQLRRFRDNPQLADSAVEELLRYDAPTQMTRRTALADLELDGHRIEPGQQVVLLRGAANRDPQVFPDPDRLDLGRHNNRHLAFDGGIHYCLGAALARLEGRIALSALASRAPRMELATETPRYRENLIIRGLAELPVRLRA